MRAKFLSCILIIFFIPISCLFAATNQTICQAKVGQTVYCCSVGKAGITYNKNEGDGATPAGIYPLRKVFYRPDRIDLHSLKTYLPIEPLTKTDGWSDDVTSAKYNQKIKLPYAKSHEKLWLDDEVYDLIVVIGYNDNPVLKNKGSAIFIHIARAGYTPTAGCIAFRKEDILAILKKLGPKSVVNIDPSGKIEFKNIYK